MIYLRRPKKRPLRVFYANFGEGGHLKAWLRHKAKKNMPKRDLDSKREDMKPKSDMPLSPLDIIYAGKVLVYKTHKRMNMDKIAFLEDLKIAKEVKRRNPKGIKIAIKYWKQRKKKGKDYEPEGGTKKDFAEFLQNYRGKI